MLSGMLVGALSPKLQKIPLTTRYKTTLICLTLGLFLTYTDYLYLLGTAITVFCDILLGKWARKQVPDKYSSINQKLSVFGSLCNQIILFGALDVNTDLKLSEITGLKMYFFTGLNAVLYVVPCNPSCDMIYQKF